jgi:hypothetical protein
MSLRYKFEKANRIIEQLDPNDRKHLHQRCEAVRAAEIVLQDSAGRLLKICNTKCKGLCCRNIDADMVITLEDMIFALTVDPSIAPAIEDMLRKEAGLFRPNCIFLKDEVGPCLFRPDGRPEMCITSFCFSETGLNREITRVRWSFFKLRWHLMSVKFKTFSRRFRFAKDLRA